MIPVTTAVLVTSGISIALALAAYVVGREDRRRLSRLRAVWRAEVREEMRPAVEEAVREAERRGGARVRETYDSEAATDRQVREARAEIADLRGQLDIANRRNRRAQDLADIGLPIPAHQLAQVLAGEPWETDNAPEVIA